MAQQVIVIKRDLMGYLVDDAGNGYNEKFQRVDDWGHVIPNPWEEPTTSSFGKGSAVAWKPQTLADYNRPDLFYHKRAEIQIDEDCLDEEPQDQDSQFQEIPDSELLAKVLRMREENAAYYKHLDEVFGVRAKITVETPQKESVDAFEPPPELPIHVHESPEPLPDPEPPKHHEKEASEELDAEPVEVIEELNLEEEISETREEYKEEVDEIERLLYGEENENLGWESSSVDRHCHPVDRQMITPTIPVSIPKTSELQHTHEPLVHNSDPLPKLLEVSDTRVVKVDHGDTFELTVIPDKEATPGSFNKRKSPDSTFQPPLKRMKAYPGATVIPIAGYLVDPGDTYVVYSKGPRPPPPKQRYVLSTTFFSVAGKHLHPPRSHPDVAYRPDPEETDAVYHFGPRPP